MLARFGIYLYLCTRIPVVTFGQSLPQVHFHVDAERLYGLDEVGWVAGSLTLKRRLLDALFETNWNLANDSH